MFRSETDGRNDRYGWIDAAAPELLRASRELVENNEACRVSDEAVAQILTAAIRLYVAKSDGEERTFPPIAGERDGRDPQTRGIKDQVARIVQEPGNGRKVVPLDHAVCEARKHHNRSCAQSGCTRQAVGED